jgi:hypothetical protein
MLYDSIVDASRLLGLIIMVIFLFAGQNCCYSESEMVPWFMENFVYLELVYSAPVFYHQDAVQSHL